MDTTTTIDASQKSLGRVASEVARILLDKNSPAFRRHTVEGQKVTVINTDKILLTGKKLQQKIYYRHTGYIGHLRKTTAEKMMDRDSRNVLRIAIRGMLPKNRLLDKRMKLLTLHSTGR